MKSRYAHYTKYSFYCNLPTFFNRQPNEYFWFTLLHAIKQTQQMLLIKHTWYFFDENMNFIKTVLQEYWEYGDNKNYPIRKPFYFKKARRRAIKTLFRQFQQNFAFIFFINFFFLTKILTRPYLQHPLTLIWAFKKNMFFISLFDFVSSYFFFFLSGGILQKLFLLSKKMKKTLTIKYKQLQLFLLLYKTLSFKSLMILIKGNPLKLEALTAYFTQGLLKDNYLSFPVKYIFFKTLYKSYCWLTKKAKLKRKLRRKIIKTNLLTFF